MTLKEAVAVFERGRHVVDCAHLTSASVAPTGEGWMPITTTTVNAKAATASNWLDEAMYYAAGRSGVLYWRARPYQRDADTISALLLISDKPPKD